MEKIQITPYKIKYLIEDGDGKKIAYLCYCESEGELFRFASSLYAFDDIFAVEIVSIKCKGIPCKYIGWQPGMRFIFIDRRNGKIVWDNCYPEWDH